MNLFTKKKKKGFTIVELVIVIAVIGVLAAILIPTFVGLVNRANVAADGTLVRELNNAIALDLAEKGETKHETMTDALEATKEYGFDVSRISTKASKNKILWDSVHGVFCYLKEDAPKVEYVPGSVEEGKELEAGDYRLWIISSTVDETYSTYLYKATETTFTTTKGLDVGNENVTAVTYNGDTDAQNVVIRTNSAGTELVVNAPNDTVKHYDAVGQVHVIAVDQNNCYEENGKAAFTQVDSGKYKTVSTADVELLFVSDVANVKVELVAGTVDHAHAINKEAADTINGTNPGVIFDYDGNSDQAEFDVYHHVNDEDKIGLTVDYNNNKTKETIIDIVEDAVEKEAVEADESDFWIVCHADEFASGSGTEQDPYIIKTARQLSLLAYNVNTLQAGYASAYYRLEKDINLSGKAWTPIGTTNGTDTLFFKGHFDGNGKSIIGLTNNGKSDADLGLYSDELSSVKGLAASYGLFGFTQNVNISDLTMESALIDGSNHFKEAGIIIGMATGSTTMTNCTVDGDSSISGKSKIGGLIGYVNLGDYDNGLGGNVNLTNCDFAGAVTVSADRAGALVGAFCAHQSGYNLGHTHVFKDCDSTGTVSSGAYGTGLIGYLYQGVAYNTFGIKTITFDNCTVNTSNFTTSGHVAKYIGRITQSTTAIIIKNDSYSANIIGNIEANTNVILKINNDLYGYQGLSNSSILPALTNNEDTYKLGQMITNAPSGSWHEYWKTDRIGELAPKGVLFKIDSTSIDLSTGELKYGAGWYDTHISDFSSYVADGYHVIVPETHAVLETVDNNNNTIYHYIYQVVAD